MATTTSYGANGECGWQHNGARCLPESVPVCCGKNGYCGYNATYCLVEYGCQFDCVNGSEFLSSTTALTSTKPTTLTSLPSSPSSAANITGSLSPSPTSSPASSSGLSKDAKIEAIVGSIVGFVIVVIVIILLYRWYQRQDPPEPNPDTSQVAPPRFDGSYSQDAFI